MNLKNKKILVTGGNGFLGSALMPMLKKKCDEVNTFRSKDYDIRKESEIIKLLDVYEPNVVIHLAANTGGILYNQKNPATLFYDNIMMGTQLIEQSRLKGVEKFVAFGTVCSFPKFTPVPFKEKDLWNGYPEETNAPYGLAKKMMLVQSQAYRQQYGFNSIFLLPVNLYGERDSFDLDNSHVIPALIRKVVEAKENDDESIIMWGTGNASREFLYVDDCADAIIKATELYNKSDPVNIGTGDEITIKDLAEKVKSIINYKGKIIWDTEKPDGQPRRCLDVSRAYKEFGFKARTNIDKGLERTIDWYISNRIEKSLPDWLTLKK